VADDRLDLQQAAERLGVHYQTAYRWVRSGRLPATLVQGRYELDPVVVDEFAAGRSEPRRPAPRRPRGGFGRIAGRAHDQLVDGAESDVRALVAGLVADGVPVATVVQEVLVPALVRIGEAWSEGRLSIWTEHRASAIVERILGEQLPNPRGRRRGTVVVAAVAGDRHSLPTAMAAAALREDNWRVHHLGADMPGEEVVSFCAGHPVDLVVLTVTAAEARAEAERTAAALEATGVRALVGAPGGTLADLQSAARGDRR